MADKCKDGFIMHPVTKKCVAKMGTIHTRAEQEKIGGVVLGSIVIGGLLGWILRDEAEDQKDEDEYKARLINEHALDRFVSDIAYIDYTSLDEDEVYRIKDQIMNESLSRFAQIEDDNELQELIDDLEVLQDYMERDSIEQGDYDSVIPFVNHIQDIKQTVLEVGGDDE
jgi:hypothetical protein